MIIHRLFFTTLVFGMLISCASMKSTKDELQNISTNEGVVIGSVLLTVEKAKEDEAGWKLHSFETVYYDWVVTIEHDPYQMFSSHSLNISPRKEEGFIKKLPAGKYKITSIKPAFSLFQPNLNLALNISFTVKPGQSSYIGKLEAHFPYRVTFGSRVGINIQDNKSDTISKLHTEYPSIIENTIKDLAVKNN